MGSNNVVKVEGLEERWDWSSGYKEEDSMVYLVGGNANITRLKVKENSIGILQEMKQIFKNYILVSMFCINKDVWIGYEKKWKNSGIFLKPENEFSVCEK